MKGRTMRATLLLAALMAAPLMNGVSFAHAELEHMPAMEVVPEQTGMRDPVLLQAAADAAPAAAVVVQPAAEGVVRKVDLAAGKLTLRHGPIESIDMPPMTMVFRVSQAKLLEGIKAGDRVRFDADRIDGIYTVTRIERLP
jgi:Cu(I)/Ag(I) efflux system protein CusF